MGSLSNAAAFGSENAAFYWVILGVGVALLVLLLIGVVVYLFLTVKAIALSQRQSNFIDSVTHELKSPLASLKLYLQTLNRRQVSPEQQADFHRFMLKDVERLDTLIDHLLDAAKTQRRPRWDEQACELEPILRAARDGVAVRYAIAPERIRILPLPDGAIPQVRGRSADLEICFAISSTTPSSIRCRSRKSRSVFGVGRGARAIVRAVTTDPGSPGRSRQEFSRLSAAERTRALDAGDGAGLYLREVDRRPIAGREVSVAARPAGDRHGGEAPGAEAPRGARTRPFELLRPSNRRP